MWDELRLRLCKCPEGRRQVKGKKKHSQSSWHFITQLWLLRKGLWSPSAASLWRPKCISNYQQCEILFCFWRLFVVFPHSRCYSVSRDRGSNGPRLMLLCYWGSLTVTVHLWRVRKNKTSINRTPVKRKWVENIYQRKRGFINENNRF